MSAHHNDRNVVDFLVYGMCAARLRAKATCHQEKRAETHHEVGLLCTLRRNTRILDKKPVLYVLELPSNFQVTSSQVKPPCIRNDTPPDTNLGGKGVVGVLAYRAGAARALAPLRAALYAVLYAGPSGGGAVRALGARDRAAARADRAGLYHF